ncbi:DUF2786 domain-containing protein [Actinoallomurus vinaceus]|uniref:DUF2786 domain-containing protein n=1 Tax=Actinoallomurus vinaceus TaxID=1080074 RepID=A0ABP8UC10_9ACTN
MTDVNESKLAQIRTLLAKAESTEFPDEAEALTAKAAELMAKYGIEQAMFADSKPGTDEVINKTVTIEQPWAREKALLLNGIALAMRCKVIQLTGSSPLTLHVFGFASDFERVELLYTSLLLQLANAMPKQGEAPGSGAQARSYRRAFALGFGTRVAARVEEAENRAKREAATTYAGRAELVLADRTALVQRAFEDEHPKARKGRKLTARVDGYYAGQAAGDRANIGGTGVGDVSRKPLS